MPQASPDLRAKFPDSDSQAIGQLEDHGYVLTKDWLWVPPDGVRSYDDMTQDDYDALTYLVHEWDFGGLKKS